MKALNNFKNIVGKLTNYTSEQSGNTIFVNNYSLLRLLKGGVDFKYIDQIHIDGILLIKLVKLLFQKNFKRYSFDETSLAKFIFGKATLNQTFVFIGTEQISLDRTIEYLKGKYENLNIVYSRNGYFTDDNELENCLSLVNDLNPTFCIVGMGTPKQENFLVKLSKLGWKGNGFTCGGFLHQSSKKEEYYPKLVDNLNIRWIYRIYDEPKLITRYFIIYPYSIIVIFIMYFRYKNN